MRLTLRTMLAYLDDILEPSDATEVGKKIEESEFATSLMHRTRDVVRRLRLAAPKLEGKGIGLDPNTVAEYLDNTLPSEKVPEFEKVCLESDVHLAEVASAHQILTLVLGEPAEIDPRSRQRMYSLGAARDPARAPARAAANGAPPAAPKRTRKRRRRKPQEVPGYLRETSTGGRGRYLLAAIVLLAVVGLGAVLMTRPPESLRPWRDSLIAGRSDENATDENADVPAAEDDAAAPSGETKEGKLQGPADGDRDASDTDATDATDEASQDAVDDGDAADADTESAADAVAADTVAADAIVDDAGAGDADEAPAVAPPSKARTKGSSAERGRSTPDDDELQMPAEGAADEPDATGAAQSAATTPADEGPEPPLPSEKPLPRPSALTDKALVADPADDAEAPSAPEGGEGIGRLITDQEALLRFDRKQNKWLRLPPRATVYASDTLLALPSFRPNVALGAGITLQLLGGASVRLEPPDAQGVPGLTIQRGRIILLSAARPDSQVRLQFADRQGTVIFGKDDATVAVELDYSLPEGADPEMESANVSAELYVASGEVRWLGEAGAEIEPIAAPAQRSLLVPAVAPAGEVVLPAWLASREMNKVEKDASLAVEEHLNPERAVSLGLKELAGHRRMEISLLALDCLAQIDEFDAFVPLLNDPTQRTAWSGQIDSLRAALARGPAVAAQVRTAFETQRGPKGLDLYRMLWGYSAHDLEGGAAAHLVKLLNHADLDFRVLGFWNLHHITGFSLYYRPEYNDAKRRPYVQKWQQKLDLGSIVPKGPAD